MTIQAGIVDWNEVGLKNFLCSLYPVSDPQVSSLALFLSLPHFAPTAVGVGGGWGDGLAKLNFGVTTPPLRDDRLGEWSSGIENLRTVASAFSHGPSS